MPLPSEDMLELQPGSAAFGVTMDKLREQGCSCSPRSIKVSSHSQSGTPWINADDPGLMEELSRGFLRPAVVDHEDDCALSGLAADPLDRRIMRDQAEALLFESTPALACGVTVLTKPDAEGEPDIDRQLAGYVEVSDTSTFGQDILARWSAEAIVRHTERDNWTRWTMIDHGTKGKILLEIIQEETEDDPELRSVIAFEYPVDRDCLMTAGATGYLLVRAGTPPESTRQPHPQGRGLTYSQGVGTGMNTSLIALSTGDQVLRMIEILDARNPNLRKNSVHEIMRSLDVAQTFDEDGIVLGKYDIEQAEKLLRESNRPLSAAIGVFNQMAVRMTVIRSAEALSTKQVADKADLSENLVERILHGSFQDDMPWVMGHQSPSSGEWEWVRHPNFGDLPTPSHYEGHDLMTSNGRMQAARALLESMGVEIPIEEVSPAMALFKSMVDFGRFESAISELLRKPPPVWASAKGFAKAMEQVQNRARIAKQLGIKNADQLTFLHLQLGHSLHIAHVLVMDSAQVNMLPEFSSATEMIDFARDTPLAFDPLFIDFTGDGFLPGIDSDISFEGEEVKILGALVNSEPDEGVLFITPIFYYGNPAAPIMAIALGTYAINRSGVRNYQFAYVLGSTERFTQPAMTLIASSPPLNKEPHVYVEYERIIGIAAERVIGALYLLEAANVQMVPRELPRRDKKRQEKRGWRIPLVVRVDRPSRRVYSGTNGNGDGTPRDFSHQFEVIGHYNHVKRGHSAACTVCNGKRTQDLVCPRCHDTGLDPDKIKPCTRIDVTTGEKTCPDGCRKIWIPAYWKGPENKPMVVKTRKIR